jgi:hypothetical protein
MLAFVCCTFTQVDAECLPLHGGGLCLCLHIVPSHTHACLGLHLQKKRAALCSLVYKK